MNKKSKIKLIISAYSVYPFIKSSEGIVNRNWLNILSKKKIDVEYLSVYINAFQKDGSFFEKEQSFLKKIFQSSKNKRTFFGVIYSVLNKLTIKVLKSNFSFLNLLWVKLRSQKITKSINYNTVVWSRILEVPSLKATLKAYKKKKFPYIININDPVLSNKNELTFEEKIILETKETAQAWTFPSKKLSDFFIEKYDLDKQRCFVIPHAMKKQEELYKRDLSNEKIKIIYTGTFYRSAFTKEFQEALIKLNENVISEKIEFVFILSQFDELSIQWLKKAIKNVTILTNLDREDVLLQIKKADCMLVVDAKTHTNLLKGKLCEAISFGIPVFSVSYQNSTMDTVVKSYGSFSSYQDEKEDIYNKLVISYNKLNDESWLKSFYEERKKVIQSFSEEEIFKNTMRVSEFALERFNNS